ncbi:MAG: acyltransferase [Fulvivirga sp.]
MKKKFSLFLYYLIANRLPADFFPLGFYFNRLRVFLARNFLTIGEGCKVYPRVNFGDGNGIVIGNNTTINENVYIEGAIIGDHVMIAPGVTLYASSHITESIDIPMKMQGTTAKFPSTIENDVWVGKNAIIMPGLIIETGSIIGAGAVVTKNVTEFSVMGGVPAKLIKKRSSNFNPV